MARQSLLLYTGTKALYANLVPTYDPVERVVLFRNYDRLLHPGVLYDAELRLPDEDENGFGFRAFDGAPLAEGRVALKWSFVTREGGPTDAPAAKGAGCADALAVFRAGACASCHSSGASAAMGLSLDSGHGLAETAVRRVAHEADTGPIAGRPQIDPGRFGTGMPIIDPGSPGTSYLLYKLLLKPENYGDAEARCTSAYDAPLPEGECLAPSAEEHVRLRDWFVQMDPMPPPSLGGLPGGVNDLRTVQRFIIGGAETTACP